MSADCFVPTKGPLAVPSAMNYGHAENPDSFRKDMQRPQTQSGYRFGQRSHNSFFTQSFFTRHNPHPSRVRHIKGLLDAPICAVNDNGFFASPLYELHFPCSNFDDKKIGTWKKSIPVNAINVNSQRQPLDLISGLQNFTGLQNYSHREQAVPDMGQGSEQWRAELQLLADSLRQPAETKPPATADPCRPKTQYSETTGRIIPPSRGNTRQGSRRGRLPSYLDQLSQEHDLETMVFQMVCQILQTDDTNAVQAWLTGAPPAEKAKMMELIQSAIKGRDDYYKQYPIEIVNENRPSTSMPAICEVEKPKSVKAHDINRLVLDEDSGTFHEKSMDVDPRPWARAPASPDREDRVKSRVSDVFQTKRPATTQRGESRQKSDLGGIKLRYTQTPKLDSDVMTERALKNMAVTEWQPDQSIVA